VFLAFGSLGVYAAQDARLPGFVASSEDLYPAAAARKLMQGSVGIELQIDDQGRARILSQTFSDAPEFTETASEVLKRGHFKVPEDWAQSGGPEQRFLVEVQFIIARGDAPCAKKPPHVADTEVVLVCRVQPIRRKSRL
jgi:hypothetical protein